MELVSLDGRFVELAISAYQFGGGRSTSEERDWDANWLMIRGRVWDGHVSWAFHDPCMTTWEARELSGWLRGLADSNAATVKTAGPDELRMWLTEPNLTFELTGSDHGMISLVVHFDAESRPPRGSSDGDQGLGHEVRLELSTADLARAVDDWDRELVRFPER